MGPDVTLTPRGFAQMRADERGKFGCTTLREDSHYGARYYTAAKRGVTIPYALEPGGATGEIIIEPSQRRAAKMPAQVERCGDCSAADTPLTGAHRTARHRARC